MSCLTFFTVSAGWLDANLMSVDKKFLHLRTLSMRLLLVCVVGLPGVSCVVPGDGLPPAPKGGRRTVTEGRRGNTWVAEGRLGGADSIIQPGDAMETTGTEDSWTLCTWDVVRTNLGPTNTKANNASQHCNVWPSCHTISMA